jgi:hypothetical protein
MVNNVQKDKEGPVMVCVSWEVKSGVPFSDILDLSLAA